MFHHQWFLLLLLLFQLLQLLLKNPTATSLPNSYLRGSYSTRKYSFLSKVPFYQQFLLQFKHTSSSTTWPLPFSFKLCKWIILNQITHCQSCWKHFFTSACDCQQDKLPCVLLSVNFVLLSDACLPEASIRWWVSFFLFWCVGWQDEHHTANCRTRTHMVSKHEREKERERKETNAVTLNRAQVA